MKKLRFAAVLLLCVCLCFTLISCNKGKTVDAREAYTQAKGNTDALKSFGAKMLMDIKYGDDAYSAYDNSSEMEITADFADLEHPVYLQNYTIKAAGQEMKSSSYYADGWTYTDDGASKTKVETDPASAAAGFASIAFDIPSAIFEKSQLTEDGGKKTYLVKPAPAEVKALLDGFSSSASYYFASINEDGSFDYDYSDIEVSACVTEDNYIESMVLDYTASFEHSEGEAKFDALISLIFTAHGTRLNIEAPADLDAYTVNDDSELGGDLPPELQATLIDDVFTLFDRDNDFAPVANYDELYAQLCDKYGQLNVDDTISYIMMFSSMYKK